MTTLLELVRRCDCFPYSLSEVHQKYGRLIPFVVDNHVVGLLVPEVVETLQRDASHAFSITQHNVCFSSDYATVEARSDVMAQLLRQWRQEERFAVLKGLRNELYPVYTVLPNYMGDKGCIAFIVERAGAGLFGFATFGVHLNLYTRCRETDRMKMWIAQRSATKSTWPGYLDNAVAGGITLGDSVYATAVKECLEEANLSSDHVAKARLVGTISYFTVTAKGIAPEIQYVYDLELSQDVNPTPNDGEVDCFYYWDMEEVRANIEAGKFKPNCALVIIDFMFRHGLLDEKEPGYLEMQQRMHRRVVLDDYLM